MATLQQIFNDAIYRNLRLTKIAPAVHAVETSVVVVKNQPLVVKDSPIVLEPPKVQENVPLLLQSNRQDSIAMNMTQSDDSAPNTNGTVITSDINAKEGTFL